MDNNTQGPKTQTNTPEPAAAPNANTPSPSPAPAAATETATDAPAASPELTSPKPVTPEPASPAPVANTIPTPAGDTSIPKPETSSSSQPADTPAPSEPVPINDVEEAPPAGPIPLVDASAAVPDAAAAPAPATDGPIISDEVLPKRSPILNSAPAKVQKFNLKYIIPIAILGVLVLGLGTYLIIDKVALEPQALDAARKASAAAATPAITNDVSVNTGSDTSGEPVIITYSSSNSLTGTDTYLLTSIDNAEGVSVISNEASTVAEFTIDWAEAKATYSDLKTATGTSTYTIDFGQGVSEIFYGKIDDNGFYLFLLDDGTVDYLDIHQALSDKSFTASGPIDGIENVVKFLDATSKGTPTILAQQATGEYYDLSTFLK